MENILSALKSILEPFTKTVRAPSMEDLGPPSGIANQNGHIVPIYDDPYVKSTPLPKPVRQAPVKIAKAAPQPQGNGGFRITVPTDNGPTEIPQDIAQILGSELDPYGLATQAAQVLLHPRQQTYTPEEVKKFGRENWNIGENPRFITQDVPGQQISTPQANGTFDNGLMRDNTGTFKLLQGSHKWNTILKANGLTDASQLNDPTLSVRYARILGDYYEQELGVPRWAAWFAAPLSFRQGNAAP